MSLQEKAKQMNSGIEFMQGKEKGETTDLLDKKITIIDYDFLMGDDGEYAVFIIKEDDTKFYFAGTVLTNNLKLFNEEEKEELQKDGLPTLLRERKSAKTKRTYVSVEFYPDAKI